MPRTAPAQLRRAGGSWSCGVVPAAPRASPRAHCRQLAAAGAASVLSAGHAAGGHRRHARSSVLASRPPRGCSLGQLPAGRTAVHGRRGAPAARAGRLSAGFWLAAGRRGLRGRSRLRRKPRTPRCRDTAGRLAPGLPWRLDLSPTPEGATLARVAGRMARAAEGEHQRPRLLPEPRRKSRHECDGVRRRRARAGHRRACGSRSAAPAYLCSGPGHSVWRREVGPPDGRPRNTSERPRRQDTSVSSARSRSAIGGVTPVSALGGPAPSRICTSEPDWLRNGGLAPPPAAARGASGRPAAAAHLRGHRVVLTGFVLAAYGIRRAGRLRARHDRRALRHPGRARARPRTSWSSGSTTSDFNELGEHWPFPRSLHAEAIDRLQRGRRPGDRLRRPVHRAARTRRDDNALADAVAEAGNVVLATTEVDERGAYERLRRRPGCCAQLGARAAQPLRHRLRTAWCAGCPTRSTGSRRLPGGGGRARPRGVRSPRLDFPDRLDRLPRAGRTSAQVAVLTGCCAAASRRTPSGTRSWWWAPPRRRSRTCIPPRSAATRTCPAPEIQANAISTAAARLPAPRGAAVDRRRADRAVRRGRPADRAALRAVPRRPLGARPRGALRGVRPARLQLRAGSSRSSTRELSLALGVVGALGVGLVLNAFERERVRDLFSRFVPEPVVDEVLKNVDEDLRLGGERRRGDRAVQRHPRLHDLLRDAIRRRP